MRLENLELGLAGAFQHENAAMAVATIEGLRALGWKIPDAAIRAGLRDVNWPGRFDVVRRNPTVILDCAHNDMSIRALVETIDAELGAQVKPRLIFGCLADKEWNRMAAILTPRIRDVTLTRVSPKRPLEPEMLLPAFAAVPARVIREPRAAIERLMTELAQHDVALVTGSVYLIGEIYPYFLAREGRTGLFSEHSA